MNTKQRQVLARGAARADRIQFIKIAWPIVGGSWIAIALYPAVVPNASANGLLLSGLAILAVAFGVVLWAAVRRAHDLDRSGWWLLALVIFGRVLQLIAIGAGRDPASPQILLATVLMALIYLSFAPGTPGPNRFGAEPARWLGPQPVTPALSLMTPAPGTADFEGDLLEVAADTYDLKSTIHFSDLMGGSQLIIDGAGDLYLARRQPRGWQVDYIVEAAAPEAFEDLKARVIRAYEVSGDDQFEDSEQPRENDEEFRLALEALAAAKTPRDLTAAILRDPSSRLIPNDVQAK